MMTRSKQFERMAAAAALVVTLSVSSGAVLAQDMPRGKTADNTEDKPGAYDPQGLHVGAFKILPKIELTETYDSNVYSSKTNTVSDSITALTPSVNISTGNQNYNVSLMLSETSKFYASRSGEDVNDYSAQLNGFYTILRDTKFTGSAGFSHAHESRGNPDSNRDGSGNLLPSAKPEQVEDTSATLFLEQSVNRAYVKAGTSLHSFSYHNVTDRDRTEATPSLRVGYAISPAYKVFVEDQMNWRRYDKTQGGISRDSDGYRLTVGNTLEMTNLLTGDFYVGYINQQYNNATFKEISGLAYGVDLTWTPTQLTTVMPHILRSIEETTNASYSGYLSNVVRVDVRHELRRNINLLANLGYTLNDYQKKSGAGNRSDSILGAGFGAKYNVNSLLYIGGDYNYTQQNSKPSNLGYTDHKVMGRIGVQY